MKLTTLKGNDCLPKKYHVMPSLISKDCIISSREDSRQGFNNAISEYDKVELVISEKDMIEIIAKKYMGSPKEMKELAKSIIQSAPSWMSLRRERE